MLGSTNHASSDTGVAFHYGSEDVDDDDSNTPAPSSFRYYGGAEYYKCDQGKKEGPRTLLGLANQNARTINEVWFKVSAYGMCTTRTGTCAGVVRTPA